MTHSRASKNGVDIKALRKENQDLKKSCKTMCVLYGMGKKRKKDVLANGASTSTASPRLSGRTSLWSLSRLIAKHKLAGLDTIERASQAIEHCHGLGP